MEAERKDWLQAESERWVRQGMISPEQRVQILGLYPAEKAGVRDRTVAIFSILGSLLVGAGVILYFAANWWAIPAWIKVGMILLATLASYGVGFYFQYGRGDSPRLGQALVFLGALLYGAGVWLIAQIFHIDSDFPLGFLAWGAGILPLAWTGGSRLILYLATGLLTIWTMTAQTSLSQYNALFPPLMLLGVLPLARRTNSRLVEAVVLLGLFLWHALNVGRVEQPGLGGAPAWVIGRLALLYGATIFLAGLARVGEVRTYLASGSLVGLFGVYLLTFAAPTWLPPEQRLLPGLFTGQAYTVVGVVALLAGLLLAAGLYARRGEKERRLLLPATLLPALAVVVGIWLPETLRLLLFNLLLFGGAVGLVALGIQRRIELLLNLGLVTFGIHLITRYFDLFFSAMDRSFFFVLGGVILLLGGWILERNRRRWVGEMEGGGQDAP